MTKGKKPVATPVQQQETRLTNAQQDAVRSWGQDNLEVLREITEADVNELWRVVFEKKSKILSADEKAALKRAGAAELRRLHLEQRPKAMPAKAAAPEVLAGWKVHPAAAVFPMMIDTELQDLALDIKANGQRVKAVKEGDLLLDGRNRAAACEIAGVKLEVEEWDGRGGSPTAFVASVNLMRRHLDENQRAMMAEDLLPFFAAEKAAALKAGQEKGRAVQSGLAPAGARPTERAPKAADLAAASANVSTRQVERAHRVKKASPEMADKVRAGEMTLGEAERRIRKTEAVVKVRAYIPPQGKYSVIAMDFPWMYDLRADDETHRGRIDYPPMTIEEGIALDVGALADDDCVLFFWITNPLLVLGAHLEMMRAWGFTPKTLHTWVKLDEEGMAKYEATDISQLSDEDVRMVAGNYGRGGTEHYIVATKGSPVVDFRKQRSVFFAKLREHSRKPDEFYRRVEEACPAPAKLEMFARESRAGWVCDGAEADKFDDHGAQQKLAGAKRHAARAEAVAS